MADISVTAASVSAGSDAVLRQRTAGAAITQGQVTYRTGNTANLADADVAGTATVDGIAVTSAASGQPVLIMTEGTLTLNAALTKGQVYVASTTAGGIAPYSDLASGDYVSLLGVATSTTTLVINIQNSGVTL